LTTAPPLANLINELTKLPGIGGKSASRLAYHILKRTAGEAEALASAILEVKQKIFRCPICNNMTDIDPCAICGDARRDPSVICVVEEAYNIATIEQTRDFKGVFHVLLGALSPLRGVGPDDIDVAGLIKRVQGGDVREVIIATPAVRNPHHQTRVRPPGRRRSGVRRSGHDGEGSGGSQGNLMRAKSLVCYTLQSRPRENWER
jgi:recombination protein RecR